MDTDWIARGIAVASLLVAIVGTGIRIVSLRRSATRQRPSLTGYMDHWMVVYGLDSKAHYLLLELNISNLSDVANSVVEYGLELGPPYNTSTRPVHYSETPLNETVLMPSPGSEIRPGPLALKGIRLDFLSTPVNIPAHESRAGWVGFPLPHVPAEVAKGVPFFLWAVVSEGKPIVLEIDLTESGYEVIQGVSPGNGNAEHDGAMD